MTRSQSTGARRRKPVHAPGRGVSIALQDAMRAHQQGHLDLAEPLYRKALHIHPGQPDALHFLGVLCHQRGRSEEAEELIRTALLATPGHADAHNNLGNIHKECGRLDAAEACYRRALDCSPRHPDALGNLAIVLEVQERPAEALTFYERLLEHAPKLARAHLLMGMFVRSHAGSMENVEQAIEFFRQAVRCDGRDVRALKALGVALYMGGQREEAIDVYRAWLARDPGDPVPRHMLASCGGEEAPLRAGDDYVRKVFDNFADSFDEQLLNKLGYRAPEVLVDAVVQKLGAPTGALDVLDAGCGTGLCGPLIRPYARHLAGVDLSSGMVGKARARGDYDVLDVAELTAYLQASPAAWDVVLSADTLVYFGDLSAVLAAAWSALRPSGWLAFTLEAVDDETQASVLSPSGRYQHSGRYVEALLTASGFKAISVKPESLRMEMGKPVPGWLVLASKDAID